MSRILILFASSYGQTRRIAETMAAELRAAGHGVELADAMARGLPPPDDYDAVIVGSRVQLGKHAHPIVEYVVANRRALDRMPSAFFSVSMAAATPGAGPDPDGYMGKLFATADWQPTRFAAFAGGLPYRQYSPILRIVMKWINRRSKHTTDTSKDHDFTDWNAVKRFATGFSHDVIAAGMNSDDPPTTIPVAAQAAT